MILVRDHRVNGAKEAFVVNVVYGTLMPNLPAGSPRVHH